MNATKHFSAVSGYLEASSRGAHASLHRDRLASITLTRQTGAGAISIGKVLLALLRHATPPDEPEWTFIDKNLVKLVLAEYGLPEELEAHYPENAPSVVEDTVEEIVGGHPPAHEINEKCHELARRLLQAGHCIVVGRCGNLIARDLPNALRVRLVGSLAKRTKRIMNAHQISKQEAEGFIRKEDALRKRYAKTHFSESNMDDPLLYDVVFNTDYLSEKEAAELIMQAALAKCPEHARA